MRSILRSIGLSLLSAAAVVLAVTAAFPAALLACSLPTAVMSPAVAADDPVAMVVRTTGAVRVARTGGADEDAAIGTRLMQGDRLLPAQGAQAVVLFMTGRRETISQPTTIEAPAQAQRAGVFERTVGTLNAVATTDARQHPNRQGMIRPIAGAPTPLSPRNGIKVMDVRPTFRWSGVPGATGYMIQIRSADNVSRMRYQAGADTSWTLPTNAPPLTPGADYLWTVAPLGQGRVAEEQRFRAAAAADLHALADGIADMVAAGIDPWTEGLFLSALLYRDSGLFYEADRALRQLEQDGAASGSAYYMLRGEVHDALGDLDSAAAAFARVE